MFVVAIVLESLVLATLKTEFLSLCYLVYREKLDHSLLVGCMLLQLQVFP